LLVGEVETIFNYTYIKLNKLQKRVKCRHCAKTFKYAATLETHVAKYHADLRTRERNISGSSAASMARRRVSEEEQEESNTNANLLNLFKFI